MAKPALTRQAYIDTAFDLISESGIEKLSMRNVASQLHVSPMAMYKHFPNKEALLIATLDEVIKRADVYPAMDTPWEQWIEQVARGMFDALCKESSWVPLLGSMQLGEQATVVTQSFVKKMTLEGLSLEQAINVFFAMIQIVIGSVCLQASLRQQSSSATAQHAQLPDGMQAVIGQDQLSIGLPLLMSRISEQISQSRLSR